ncbi:MAG: TolC family protein [Rikenellaceae bacterium]|nr:TolC family protein [Rikenellaceae bacterium]
MKKLIIIILCPLFAYGQTDSLARWLDVAARNNPGVQAAHTSWQAALQRLPQAGAWQDPQFDAGFFLQPMMLSEGRQVAEFRLMQMFPWFGARKAARTEAENMAQMAFEQLREARDGLFLDVYTQWFTLCRLRRQEICTRRSVELLAQLEELAMKRFSTGGAASSYTAAAPSPSGGGTVAMNGMAGMSSASPVSPASPSGMPPALPQPSPAGAMPAMGAAGGGMSEVLRIRLEIIELESRVEDLLSETAAAKARFNALLNRAADAEVVVPDTLAQIAFRLDLDTASAQIAARNPMIAMLGAEAASYKAKAQMDKRMSYPMFGVGLQYMLMKKTAPDPMTVGSNPMNGKDMLMPMASVSLPIFRGRYRAQQRENALMQQSARERQADALNTLTAELHRLRHELDGASRRIALYRRQSELARTTCNLALQEFIAGRGPLSDAIAVQRQLLNYELETAVAVAAYNTMVANIQKLGSYEN